MALLGLGSVVDVRSLHWPHILQILVPTFSAFSVAQGYVSSDPENKINEEELGTSMEESDLVGMGEEAAEKRRRMEEERRGRMCPICLGKPVAGRMTKCGHVRRNARLELMTRSFASLVYCTSFNCPTFRKLRNALSAEIRYMKEC